MRDEKQIAQEILDAIKTDNSGLFAKLTQPKVLRALCFGRFPILSLCYLYKSKKILKANERQLSELNEYFIAPIDEPSDAYQIFKNSAGIFLRLYNEDSIVTPAEALAILNETAHLKQNFLRFKPNEKSQENIIKILTAKLGRAQIKNGRLSVSAPKLKTREKALLSACMAVLVVFISFFGIFAGFIPAKLGIGTASAPYRVSSLTGLEKAKSGMHYILTKDITLPAGYNMDSFAGVLDGNGKTIYSSGAPLFNRLESSGSVKNLTFKIGAVHAPFQKQIIKAHNGYGFFIYKNDGALIDLNIIIHAEITAGFSDYETEHYIGVAAAFNSGKIERCKISGSLSMTGGDSVSIFAGGIAGKSLGSIIASETSQDFTLRADTCAAGGIAGHNDGGKIEQAKNRAVILVSTAARDYIPVAGGIAAYNRGTILKSENYGNIESVKNNNLLSDSGGAAGGIAGINQGKGAIKSCINNAKIFARGVRAPAFAGGIAAKNADEAVVVNGFYHIYEAEISGSRSDGEVEVSSTAGTDRPMFAGGVTALCEGGRIIDNVSQARLKTNLLEWTCAGGIIGGVKASFTSTDTKDMPDLTKYDLWAEIKNNLYDSALASLGISFYIGVALNEFYQEINWLVEVALDNADMVRGVSKEEL